MTKSQVYLLDKSLNDLPLNNRPNIKYEDLIYTSDAMEEYSEEMACGFTEWIIYEDIDFRDNTAQKGNIYLYNGEAKTTKELYQLYLEHLNK